jgi:hypothetical protein
MWLSKGLPVATLFFNLRINGKEIESVGLIDMGEQRE